MSSHQLLELRELNQNDETAFLRGYEDWKNEDLDWYSFVWKPGMSHQEHLNLLKDQKDKAKIPQARVPSTMLYGFVGGEIVGRFNIRHELNAFLSERGGHIGYAVSPKHRKKGYASQMFQQGLVFCHQLGLEKILVTCADQNMASWKIIEKFGGSLENRIFDSEENEYVRRYWLNSDCQLLENGDVAHKAVAYVTRFKESRFQLLVFDHDKEFVGAGTQVPCGTVDAGETPERTVLRELFEEAGIAPLLKPILLDVYQFYRDFNKILQRRNVFHLDAAQLNLPEVWTHKVQGQGDDNGLHFHYYWIDLKLAKGKLSARFDDSIDLLLRKLSIE